MTTGRRVRRLGSTAGIALLLAACGSSEPTVERPREGNEALAEQFVSLFLEARDAETQPLMTPQMQAAMTQESAAQFRQGLATEFGALTRKEPAWFEDRVPGYRRFRVPVIYERGRFDFRVVIDTQSRVAGFFREPHLDPLLGLEQGRPPGEEIEVVVGHADTGLPGTLTLPRGEGVHPGVVLVHGSGPQDRDETIGPNKPFRDLAWGLAARGVAVLRYDKRTLVRPQDLIPFGDALTVREEVVFDARAALELLRSRPEIDRERIFVLGHSLGGTLAPRIAAEPPRPAGVIVLAGSTEPLPEKMVGQLRYILSTKDEVTEAEQEQLRQVEAQVRLLRAALDGKSEPPPGRLLGAPFAYYRDLEDYDAPAQAAASGLPVLVLQGGRDYQVTLDDFARWQSALAAAPQACLRTYDELDHLFRRGSEQPGPQDYERPAPVDVRVLDDVARWIKESRCPA